MKPFTAEQAIDLLNALDLNNADLAKVATEVLHGRGFAVKIYGADDIRQRLYNTTALQAHYDDIIGHIMNGDDWATMEEEVYLEDGNIYALIEGTHGDHYEWFAPEAP